MIKKKNFIKKREKFNIDGSAFLNKDDKNKLIFKILKISALTLVCTLFIVGSIWDQKISKAVGDLNDNGVLSWFCLFWDKLAYTMTVPFMFAGTGILIESINFKYKAKFKFLSPLIVIYYVLFIILFSIIISKMIYQQSTFSSIFGGKGRDYWFGLDGTSTAVAMSIQLIIEVIIMCVTSFYLRINFSKRTDLLTKNYWIDTLKIFAAFALFGFLFDPTLKTFWGRPYWVNVDYIYVFNHLPSEWTQNIDKSTIHDAPYLDWWQIQGFNSHYWDYLLGKAGEGNHSWSDKAFPSGHMNSASMPVYGFLLYFMNEKRKQKINWWKWFVFAFFVFDVGVMAFMELLSRTHYLTDLMFSLIIILTFFKSLCYGVDHLIYKILSFIWNKQKKTYNMLELNNGIKTLLFVTIDNSSWVVAKIKNNKIDKSRKYKYWHKKNIIYKK